MISCFRKIAHVARKYTLALLVISAVTACGGGGGGTASTSAQASATIDATGGVVRDGTGAIVSVPADALMSVTQFVFEALLAGRYDKLKRRNHHSDTRNSTQPQLCMKDN